MGWLENGINFDMPNSRRGYNSSEYELEVSLGDPVSDTGRSTRKLYEDATQMVRKLIEK